jgi:sugar lactone lactonase YvrE
MHIRRKAAAAAAALAVAAYAVETRTWEHSAPADFEKGTLEGLSLRSDGRLFLAPASKQLLDSSAAYLWALAVDSKGNVYAGGGGPGTGAAKVFRITPAGATETFAELEGFEIQALAVDRQDRLYAATSPDGKVYRIREAGKAEIVYEPRTKYIWALAFTATGDLLVATGEPGEIHRVSTSGQGSVFVRTEETHVRALAADAHGNVFAGTEPGGLIMRVSPGGAAFVLHQASKREVTALAVAPDGSMYAAAVGDKQAPALAPPPTPVAPAPAPAQTTGPASAANVTLQRTPAAPAPAPAVRTTVTGGSEVVRIDREGLPRTVWSDNKEIVYALATTAKGEVLLGTGDDGKLFRLEPDRLYTLVLKVPPKQITALFAGRDGSVYAATGNVGRVYRIGPELSPSGSLESAVLDAETFSYWGAVRFTGALRGGSIALEARSGNLDRPRQNWSAWSKVELSGSAGRIQAPPARFLQYRLTLTSADRNASPEVSRIEIAYLNKNVAPEMEKIAITPPNYRFPPRALTLSSPKTITLPPLTEAKPSAPPKPVSGSPSQSVQYAKGYLGARWLAGDDNGDELVFKVEIRGAVESEWKLLQDDLSDPYLSWDSTAFPDGEYRLRVTASDRKSNPPDRALTAELVSEPFLIDNTPPEISGLTATRSGQTLRVAWKAADALSRIQKAEYSLNGRDWIVAEPVTRLTDSPQLDFALELAAPGAGEQTVAIRVTDEFDNQRVASVVVK